MCYTNRDNGRNLLGRILAACTRTGKKPKSTRMFSVRGHAAELYTTTATSRQLLEASTVTAHDVTLRSSHRRSTGPPADREEAPSKLPSACCAFASLSCDGNKQQVKSRNEHRA